MSAVDEQVQNAIYGQAIQPALRTYLTKLRENAYIDVAPGFVDTGASAKQTKPVFSGATPPPEKRKKVEQKARLEDKPAAPGTSTAAAPAVNSKTSAKNVSIPSGKKSKKIHREKIRYGQAPRNSLPSAPEETLTTGTDQGAGAASSVLPTGGEAIATIDQSTVASNADPLGPAAEEHRKTRFSDRAATEAQTKAAAKVEKAKVKAAATPLPLTTEQSLTQKTQEAPLGLSGDTATKKKPKKVKGAPKERIQQMPPTPVAPKPDATPIPPKSVRDNGEPVVTPAPAAPPAAQPTQ
jgi:peptidyl-prolyl cis-trans isomerase SurA